MKNSRRTFFAFWQIMKKMLGKFSVCLFLRTVAPCCFYQQLFCPVLVVRCSQQSSVFVWASKWVWVWKSIVCVVVCVLWSAVWLCVALYCEWVRCVFCVLGFVLRFASMGGCVLLGVWVCVVFFLCFVRAQKNSMPCENLASKNWALKCHSVS